jgi:hypothetical protein
LSTLSLYGFCDPICEFLFLNLSDLLGVVVCGSTALLILGLSCWICGFLVKFLVVCVFVNLGLCKRSSKHRIYAHLMTYIYFPYTHISTCEWFNFSASAKKWSPSALLSGDTQSKGEFFFFVRHKQS